jgi:hypothetical protein
MPALTTGILRAAENSAKKRLGSSQRYWRAVELISYCETSGGFINPTARCVAGEDDAVDLRFVTEPIAPGYPLSSRITIEFASPVRERAKSM